MSVSALARPTARSIWAMLQADLPTRARLDLMPLVRVKFDIRWPSPQPGHAAAAMLAAAVLLLVAVAVGTPG